VQLPLLSIIIPAYNEQSRLPDTLQKVGTFLGHQDYSYEVIVVNNNSTDNTAEIINEYSSKFPFISGIFEAAPGKGAAVRAGMRSARGQYRFMSDADLSMPINEVNRFFPPLLEGIDIAIASREAEGAVRYQEPLFRHLGGRVMNWLIQFLILPGLNDTQCGFKCFSAPVAEDLFQFQTLPGWAFDIELLFVARQRGYSIQEIPIPWTFDQESKVSAVRDALKILMDIRTILANHQQGLYDPEN
jgi:glycosyltransferase involved in cell wall biosynthesis